MKKNLEEIEIKRIDTKKKKQDKNTRMNLGKNKL